MSHRRPSGPKSVKLSHTDDMSAVDAIAYTDGGANPVAGAFAVYARFHHQQDLQCSAFAYGVTSNAMELTGALTALRLTEGLGRVRIVSDSQYTIQSCGQWMHGWNRSGRLWGYGKPLANLRLMQDIFEAQRGRSVEWRWQRGHAGHYWNELCDKECTRQIRLAERMLG